MNDREVGRRALGYFWDAWGHAEGDDFEAFVNYYSTPLTPDFSVDLGRTIRISETPDSQVHAAMLHLAASAPMNKVPRASSFIDSIADPYLNPDFMTYIQRKATQVEDAVVAGVKDTAKVATGVVAGGAALYALYIVGAMLVMHALEKHGMGRA